MHGDKGSLWEGRNVCRAAPGHLAPFRVFKQCPQGFSCRYYLFGNQIVMAVPTLRHARCLSGPHGLCLKKKVICGGY